MCPVYFLRMAATCFLEAIRMPPDALLFAFSLPSVCPRMPSVYPLYAHVPCPPYTLRVTRSIAFQTGQDLQDDTGLLTNGADLQWVSQYPSESEVLLPSNAILVPQVQSRHSGKHQDLDGAQGKAIYDFRVYHLWDFRHNAPVIRCVSVPSVRLSAKPPKHFRSQGTADFRLRGLGLGGWGDGARGRVGAQGPY